MNKKRRVNIIKALKYELNFYKNQPVKIVRESIPLKHLRLISVFTQIDVAMMPKDVIPDLLIRRMSEEFYNSFSTIPVNIYFDEESLCYKAEMDLWVKNEANSVRGY